MIFQILKRRKLTSFFLTPTVKVNLCVRSSFGGGVCLKFLAPLLPAALHKSVGLSVDCLIVWDAFKRFMNKSHLIDWSLCLCRGFIALEGKYLVLEPTPGRSDGTHRIYSAEHLHLSTGTCGHGFNISSSSAADGSSEGSSPFRSFSSRVRVTSDDESSSTVSAGRSNCALSRVLCGRCVVLWCWCPIQPNWAHFFIY